MLADGLRGVEALTKYGAQCGDEFGRAVATDGEIIGQLCNEELQVWMVGATVYTHLYDDDGVVYDTVTDINGTIYHAALHSSAYDGMATTLVTASP